MSFPSPVRNTKEADEMEKRIDKILGCHQEARRHLQARHVGVTHQFFHGQGDNFLTARASSFRTLSPRISPTERRRTIGEVWAQNRPHNDRSVFRKSLQEAKVVLTNMSACFVEKQISPLCSPLLNYDNSSFGSSFEDKVSDTSVPSTSTSFMTSSSSQTQGESSGFSDLSSLDSSDAKNLEASVTSEVDVSTNSESGYFGSDAETSLGKDESSQPSEGVSFTNVTPNKSSNDSSIPADLVGDVSMTTCESTPGTSFQASGSTEDCSVDMDTTTCSTLFSSLNESTSVMKLERGDPKKDESSQISFISLNIVSSTPNKSNNSSSLLTDFAPNTSMNTCCSSPSSNFQDSDKDSSIFLNSMTCSILLSSLNESTLDKLKGNSAL